jgi:hypothetical protein
VLGHVEEVREGEVVVNWGITNDPERITTDSIESSNRSYAYTDGDHRVMLVKRGDEIFENGGVEYDQSDQAADKQSSLEVIRELGQNERFIITFEGNDYHYYMDGNYMANRRNISDVDEGNGSILLAVFNNDEADAMAAVGEAYGYTPGCRLDRSTWPESSGGAEDTEDLRNALRMLVEHGCTVRLDEEDNR